MHGKSAADVSLWVSVLWRRPVASLLLQEVSRRSEPDPGFPWHPGEHPSYGSTPASDECWGRGLGEERVLQDLLSVLFIHL